MNLLMIRAVAIFFVSAILYSPSSAQTGQTRPLVIGASIPLTGPLAAYGTEFESGLRLAAAKVNTSGGVRGRPLALVVKDDAGQPALAVANAKELVEAGSLALTGLHGSGSVEAVLPFIESSDVPLIGVASGAEVLRQPARRSVFNLRAGIREEAAAIVLHLDTVGMADIAAIAQDDALGRAALEGIHFELTRLAIRPQALVSMGAGASAGEMAIAVASACSKRPRALVLALDARNALPVIRTARAKGCSAQIYLTSEAGAQLATPEMAGVIVAQVLPHPSSVSLPLLIDLQRQLSLKQPGSVASYPLLEGYLYVQVIAEALGRCPDPGRACLIAAMELRPIDVGGYRVQFAPGDHRGSRFVEMTIVSRDGHFRR